MQPVVNSRKSMRGSAIRELGSLDTSTGVDHLETGLDPG